MKFFRYILLASLLISGNVVAQEKEGSKILVNNQSILIDDNRQVVVTMDITLPGNLEVPTNNVLTITPVLKDSTGTHMATLPSVMVYGRNRYLIDERANDIPADAYTVLRREKETDQSFDYTTRISYEKWMHGADLELASEIKGCANCKEEENSMYVTSAYLERYTVKQQVVFVEPEVEHKTYQDEHD